ncbi:uncharacterized protein TRAVEDRAFT_22378 [Trametes versicolor FP-101664 SS1]|uniref:uncharacterized protein n=1 Tax=Trametes versicolor (strain FP-101664) TaxID=717944 RepID=UPI0004621A03|nr:uncharacterized protein TRAVEDRAFT_22378 [Trametes versicolor FP-101664 SS1]EIW55983.1 hypothetical protein TRAVEDRAFT_22378 [Trametes versicolor FP-101664 SS1]
MPVPSSSLAQTCSEGPATFAAREATEDIPLGGPFCLSSDSDQQAWPEESSFPLEHDHRLQDTQTIASSSGTALTHASDPPSPSSSSAGHPPVLPTETRSPPTTRSRGKAPNAVAGPSRLVPIAPQEATTQAETPAVTVLRRSGRKRTAPAAGYVDAAVLPPAKKRKATKGSASKVRHPSAAPIATSVEHAPVAGPSRQATRTAKPSTREERSAKAPSKKGTESKRPRRTRAQVDMHKVAGMPAHACDVDGCALIWNPYKHDDNKEHLETHFDTADLEGDADLVCVFDVCKAPVPGKDLLQHMEIHHIGRPYLCPIRCGWQSCRSSYQKQHMDLMHEGVHWE